MNTVHFPTAHHVEDTIQRIQWEVVGTRLLGEYLPDLHAEHTLTISRLRSAGDTIPLTPDQHERIDLVERIWNQEGPSDAPKPVDAERVPTWQIHAYDTMIAPHLERLQDVVSARGMDGRAGDALLALAADQIAAAPTSEQIYEIARRAYAEGCGEVEYHEAHVEDVVEPIVAEVLGGRAVRSERQATIDEIVAERAAADDDAFWKMEERIDRIRKTTILACEMMAGGDDARIEVKEHEIRLGLGSAGPLCIPYRVLDGIDPVAVFPVVQAYIMAYQAGGRTR